MAQIDEIKGKITFLQVIFVLIIGASFSLIGWIANTEESNYLVLATITVSLLSVLSVFLTRKILKNIKKLGEL